MVAAAAAGAAAALLVGSPRRAARRLRGTGAGWSGAPAEAADDVRAAGLPVGPAADRPLRAVALTRRAALTVLAAVVGLLTGSVAAAVGAGVAAVVADRLLARLEPGSVRRRNDAVVAALPVFTDLVASTVRAGVAPTAALRVCAEVLGGPLGEQVLRVVAAVDLGVSPEEAWDGARAVPGLEPLAHAMVRGSAGGGSPVVVLERCSVDARRIAHSAAARRAQSVGVAAAAPLGLCFLPAFVLVSVVPTVVGGLAGFFR